MTDDINERRLEETTCKNSHLQDLYMIGKILENVPIGIIIQDVEGRDILANVRAEEILGIDRERIAIRRYDSEEWDARDRDGRPKNRDDLVAERVRRTGEPVLDEEVVIQRPDGSDVTLLVNAAPITDEDGSYGGLIYAFEDITQRILTEKELAAHKERLQELVEARTAELEEANRSLASEIEERRLRGKELQILTEQMRAFSQRMETVREEEKARFAARIHDTFEQSLAVLKMQVKSLERSMPDDQKSGDELERIYTTLDGFLDEIQGVTEELMPRILSDAGLVAAMEWQMKDLHRRTGIDTYVQSDLGGIVISEALSTFIYRVFQEAIQNMVQHSRALRAEALLSIEDGFLTLSIIDNDRGISRAELANPESLGLLWMKERAKHFGGSVEISERPRKGTEVILRIPISSV